jgi:hypothetical protein
MIEGRWHGRTRISDALITFGRNEGRRNKRGPTGDRQPISDASPSHSHHTDRHSQRDGARPGIDSLTERRCSADQQPHGTDR